MKKTKFAKINPTKNIYDYKIKQLIFHIKRHLFRFCKDIIPFTIIVAIILIMSKMFFFHDLTYTLILKITAIASCIWLILTHIADIIDILFFKQDDIAFSHIDTIAIIIIAYFLIKWADSNCILPTWSVLGAAIFIGIIFYHFLHQESAKYMIQAFACIFETYFIVNLLPWRNLLEKTCFENINDHIYTGIISVLLYLLIFQFHDKGTSKTIKNIFEKIHRKKKTTVKSSSTASSSYREFDNTIYNNLLHALGYSDNFNQLPGHSFDSIEYIVSKDSYVYLFVLFSYTYVTASLRTKYTIDVYDQYGNLLETLETTVTVGKNEEFRDLLSLQERYHLYHCRKCDDKMEVKEQIIAWKNAAKNSSETHSETYYQQSSSETHSETHNQQSSSETRSNQDSSSQVCNDESFFNGCTDKESLTKRYHQLMKTFHPDNPNGDHEMSQRIQNAYDTLRKKYE